jgi:RHS repeat-associated protein
MTRSSPPVIPFTLTSGRARDPLFSLPPHYYCYDPLNRVTGKAYTAQTCSNGLLPTPLVSYYYDQSSYDGLAITNSIGHRTGMSDQAGAEAWSYDIMGRPLSDLRTTNSLSKTVTYSYNLDGSLSTMSYPTAANGSNVTTLTYQPGGAGRPLNLLSSGNGFVGDAHYTPSGALCYLQDYRDGTWTAVGTFNPRQQPATYQVIQQFSGTSPTVCAATGTVADIMDFTYNFVDANSHNNGNVQKVSNNIDWHRTQNFTYDPLSRISTAYTNADNQPAFQGDNSIAACWAETYTYDPWGNLISLGPNATTQPNYVGCTQESGFNYTNFMGTNNRITETGFTYDAAGNITASPGPSTYVYDAENHLTSASTPAGSATYTYDGDGKRLTKSTGTMYWYGANSEAFLETDLSNNMRYNYFFFNGQRVGRIDTSNSVTWYLGDHLGSSRVVWSLAAQDESDFYPFGGERVISSGTANTYKFTGKERDSESGLDYFGARFNSSTMGRFMSPDAFYKDSHVGDPQSWNKYAYARNNPLRYVDPTGENATISTTCSTDGNNQTTCNVNIPASIAIYAAPGSGLTQEQLNGAASTIQSSIQNTWSGSFQQDGVTYNVSTQVSVQVAESEGAASNTGAQNVIGLSNGQASASAQDLSGASNSLGTFLRGQDTGTWNYNTLGGDSNDAAHEFSHLLGVGDHYDGNYVSNGGISNTPQHATSSDLRWGIQEATSGVKSWLNAPQYQPMRYGEVFEKPQTFSGSANVGAPSFGWWK